MSEPPEKESDDKRGSGNLLLLVFFVVIVGISVWLVNALLDARHADECLTAGQRNCNPVEATPR
jgi:hypothetical protein